MIKRIDKATLARERKHANEKRWREENWKRVLELGNIARRKRMADPKYRAKVRARIRERYRTDKAYRAKIKANHDARYAAKKHVHFVLRAKILAHYGGKCSCCGESEPMFLEFDHVNGGGRKHHRAVGSSGVYRAIIESGYSADYRLLCSNCNMGRWRNGGVCPHQMKRGG